MSDITKLTSKILQDADKRYEQAVQQAKTESRQQLELKKRQLEQQKEERLARFKREKQNELHLKVSDLHVKSRNKLLATKQQVLDGLFSEALNQMKHLPQSRFDQFVITSINKTKLKGKAELILGEYSSGYASEAAQMSWEQGAASLAFTVAEDVIPRKSGFLLKQEAIEFNFTFEALLAAEEEELSNRLLQLIFDKE